MFSSTQLSELAEIPMYTYSTPSVQQVDKEKLGELASKINAYLIACNVWRTVHYYFPEAHEVTVQSTWGGYSYSPQMISFTDEHGQAIELNIKHWLNDDDREDGDIRSVDEDEDKLILRYTVIDNAGEECNEFKMYKLSTFLQKWFDKLELEDFFSEVVQLQVQSWHVKDLVMPIVYVPIGEAN